MKDPLQKCDNITLHRDGTTKKGRHYYGLEFSIKEKTIKAGVREGKADTDVDCGISLLVFYVACNDISVINLTAQMSRRNEEEVVPTVGLPTP